MPKQLLTIQKEQQLSESLGNRDRRKSMSVPHATSTPLKSCETGIQSCTRTRPDTQRRELLHARAREPFNEPRAVLCEGIGRRRLDEARADGRDDGLQFAQ